MFSFQNAKNVRNLVPSIVVFLIALGAPQVFAQESEEMIESLEIEQTALLAAYPALEKIDNAIRSDCEEKNDRRIAGGAFCGCAAAMTMKLWRMGADPKMIPRLNKFLQNPTEEEAETFLRFQGPELYVPFCTEILGE